MSNESNDQKLYEVRTSRIHNKGVYASKDISKGTNIIEYSGEKITKEEADKRLDESFKKHKEKPEENAAVYIFELNDEYDLDGDIPLNDAKYINHSCDPNCDFEIKEDHIWLFAIKDIKEGEELTYNYGFDFDEDTMDHPCKCGSANCAGYIVSDDEWSKLKEYLKKLEEEKKQS
jgi:SET domain-containing protein